MMKKSILTKSGRTLLITMVLFIVMPTCLNAQFGLARIYKGNGFNIDDEDQQKAVTKTQQVTFNDSDSNTACNTILDTGTEKMQGAAYSCTGNDVTSGSPLLDTQQEFIDYIITIHNVLKDLLLSVKTEVGPTRMSRKEIRKQAAQFLSDTIDETKEMASIVLNQRKNVIELMEIFHIVPVKELEMLRNNPEYFEKQLNNLVSKCINLLTKKFVIDACSDFMELITLLQNDPTTVFPILLKKWKFSYNLVVT